MSCWKSPNLSSLLSWPETSCFLSILKHTSSREMLWFWGTALLGKFTHHANPTSSSQSPHSPFFWASFLILLSPYKQDLPTLMHRMSIPPALCPLNFDFKCFSPPTIRQMFYSFIQLMLALFVLLCYYWKVIDHSCWFESPTTGWSLPYSDGTHSDKAFSPQAAWRGRRLPDSVGSSRILGRIHQAWT